MSLAKRLALSIARLYAYAMAPDDHTEEERREIIDQAGEAIDAANTVVWFEETGKARRCSLESISHGHGKVAWFLEIDGVLSGSPEGIIEAMKIAKKDEARYPEVDERNSERKNHDEGTKP
jgi:hypothetical protein